MRFRDAALEEFHRSGRPPRYVPPELRKILRRKLAMLEHSRNLNDLRSPPSNHLEKLRFDLAGHYSIRVNKQFRIVFAWTENGAEDVYFDDYH